MEACTSGQGQNLVYGKLRNTETCVDKVCSYAPKTFKTQE